MSSRNTQSKSKKNVRANTMIRRRIIALMAVFGVVTFGALFIKLFKIQIIDHDMYAAKAATGQTRDLGVSAKRGKILDRKGETLAKSATVQNLIISPKDIEKNEIDQDLFVNRLSEILGIDKTKIEKHLEDTNSQYRVVQTQIEGEMEEELRQFINDNDLYPGVYLKPDSKRYYPFETLASQILGFTNAEGEGVYGLESIYNQELSGEKGRIVTTKTASGVEMLSNYEKYIDSKDGKNLNLTIDASIQRAAESTLREGIERFEVQNGGFCLVMNPKTGEVYAMAASPNYDPNKPGALMNEAALEKLEKLKEDPEVSEEDYEEARLEAVNKQWHNRIVSDPYEPGSTFKPLVMAMALEEGLAALDSTYTCTGSIMVPGWPEPIHCSYRAGHGTQTLEEALKNSCNPAMVQINEKVGNQMFYEYVKDFGLMSKTGIDLPNEQGGHFWSENKFFAGGGDLVSLATASFGQRFTITPLGLVTAISAIANGGYIVEPYTVQSITDEDGNIVQQHEAEKVRQVISKETADTVLGMMESVVDSGGGKNAKVEGYRIAGKTGTAETTTTNTKGDLIVSFIGIAPADDPEIVVLLAYDSPKPAAFGANVTSGGHYISGGSMAAPMAGELIAEVLTQLGIQKQTGESASEVKVPYVSGKSLEEAKAYMAEKGLQTRVVGSGDTVTDQTPVGGAVIPKESTVVLYMGSEKPTTEVTVPDLSGKTYSAARKELEQIGLYIRGSGAEGSSQTVAFSQSREAGTKVELGTVIEVRFTDNSIKDYVEQGL